MRYRQITMENIAQVQYGANELAPVTVIDPQFQGSAKLLGGLLMCANANEDALRATLEDGYATFWSRSKGRLWRKGETSGNLMIIRAVFADCDWDALVYSVEAPQAACHNGTFSCFENPTIGEL